MSFPRPSVPFRTSFNASSPSSVLVPAAADSEQARPVSLLAVDRDGRKYTMSSHSLTNTASSTSLSPSIANLNALSSPRPLPQTSHVQQRRMTASAMSPPSSLNLPEPVYGHPGHAPSSPRRPPSPLRNDFVPRRPSQDSQSGNDAGSDDEDHDDDDHDDDEANRTWARSQSPSTSVTQFAANIAQRVGSFMTPVLAAKALPTDAELEAEAMRERDRSRREAERILTLEAEERRAMEERVLAMMNSSPQSLPPPARGRSQTLPNTPSPSHSAREGGTSWWTAAKNRLTPTKEKEPLTPAQQIIQEVKARDKDKKITKGKQGPTSAPNSGSDLNLKIPSGGPQPRTYSPTSPSPHRTPVRLSPQPATQPPVNLSPISLQRGPSPGGSPAREQPPLYATFTPSGTLDVPGTLLTIAKRFEKLERWTVSHVRALEERMGDVERWLVERESERGKEKEDEERGIHVPESEIGTLKDEVAELQSRIGELGREMARFATSAAAGSNASVAHESRVIYAEGSMINSQETASAIATASVGAAIVNTMTTPRRVPSLTARESTSPPLARVVSHRTGTRLPYPTGDYASPDVISPTHTPASSPPAASRPTSMVISGLPSMSSPLGTPGSMSPPTRAMSPTPSGLPAPSIQAIRRGSISPSPLPAGRKRYTVALGGPIVAPPEVESEYEREREKAAMGSAYSMSVAGSSEDDDEDMSETLGKKGAARAMAATKLTSASEVNLRSAPSPGSRARAQSTYGGGSANALQSNQAQTKHRFRSQSTDFRSDAALGSDPHPTKFVDPLILRRQSKSEKAKENKPLVGPGKKVPIGELVAFFDSEKKN